MASEPETGRHNANRLLRMAASGVAFGATLCSLAMEKEDKNQVKHDVSEWKRAVVHGTPPLDKAATGSSPIHQLQAPQDSISSRTVVLGKVH